MPTPKELIQGSNFKMARAYVNGCIARKEVLAGSCDAILERVSQGDSSPEKILRRAHIYIFGTADPETGVREPGRGQGFLNVEHVRGPENNGSAIARRLQAGKFLTEAAAERLGAEWNVGFAGFGAESILEPAGRQFEARESRDDLVDPGPLPRTEVRLRRAIGHHSDQLSRDPDVIDKIVHEFRDLPALGISDGELNRKVAERLAMPHRSEYWRGDRFDYCGGDEIYHPGYVEPEKRQAQEAERNAQLATGRYNL